MLGARTFLVTFAVLTAPTAAQPEVRVAVQTPITATAEARKRMTSTAPAGVATEPVNVDARAAYIEPAFLLYATAEASSWVVPQPLGVIWSANVAIQGPGIGALLPWSSRAQVAGTVRVTIDDAKPGDLVISARYLGDTLGDVQLQASVSGSPAVPTLAWSLVIGFGPRCVRTPIEAEGPVVVDVAVSLMASHYARFASGQFAIQLQWVPSGAPTAPTMLPTWDGCGPTLFGTDDTRAGVHALEFTTRDAIPRAPVVLVFGAEPAFTPLRPTCTLYTQPVNGVLLLADEAGSARFPLTLPAAVPPGLIYLQSVSFDATGAVLTSNLLEVEFGDC